MAPVATAKPCRKPARKRKRRDPDTIYADSFLESAPNDGQSYKKPKRATKAKKASPKKNTPAQAMETAELTDEQKKRWDDNVAQSALLRLPAELRNRILVLALGGRTIHVWSDDRKNDVLGEDRKLRRSVCTRGHNVVEEADTAKQPTVDFATRHHRCHHSRLYSNRAGARPTRKGASTALNLNLLSVCRQLHQEAALLPFQENDFIFEWVLDLEGFIKHLIPSQVEAVQHIGFVYHDFNSDDEFEDLILSSFKKLKSFVAFVEIGKGHDVLGVHGLRFLNQEEFREHVTQNLLRFQQLPIKTAKVPVSDDIISNPALKETFASWAKKIEQQLKQDWEDKKKMAEMAEMAVKGVEVIELD